MSYRKFDAPAINIDDSRMKVYGAFQLEAQRRALQGIANRVISGTGGTTLVTATVAAGSTGGVQVTNAVRVIINGSPINVLSADNNALPSGTQGTNTVAKYLVYASGTGSVSIGGPGNVVDKGDYEDSAAGVVLAAAAAKLPDLPDGGVALGYVLLHAPTATAITNRGVGELSTMGTATYADLVCMPYDA